MAQEFTIVVILRNNVMQTSFDNALNQLEQLYLEVKLVHLGEALNS